MPGPNSAPNGDASLIMTKSNRKREKQGDRLRSGKSAVKSGQAQHIRLTQMLESLRVGRESAA